MKCKNIRGEGDYRCYKSLVFLTSAKEGGGGIRLFEGLLLPTSHPREDARVTRQQYYKADARVSFGTGRKNLE